MIYAYEYYIRNMRIVPISKHGETTCARALDSNKLRIYNATITKTQVYIIFVRSRSSQFTQFMLLLIEKLIHSIR